MGLDLAGSEKRASGYSLIISFSLEDFGILRKNEDILNIILSWKPNVIAIDSPLSDTDLPYRECDYKLKMRGISPLPLNLPGMKMLIRRALWLKSELEKHGITVIETYPYAVLRFLGYEKKPKNKTGRAKIAKELLGLFGIRIRRWFSSLTADELDAILCGITAYAYARGNYTEIKGENCSIIIPKLEPKIYN